MGELGKVEEAYPVVLSSRDVVSKILLEHCIDLLYLAVGLGVEGGGEIELCTEQGEE